jgi:hypothetical protein
MASLAIAILAVLFTVPVIHHIVSSQTRGRACRGESAKSQVARATNELGKYGDINARRKAAGTSDCFGHALSTAAASVPLKKQRSHGKLLVFPEITAAHEAAKSGLSGL